MKVFLFAVMIICLTVLVQSRTMWGAKKKREETEAEDIVTRQARQVQADGETTNSAVKTASRTRRRSPGSLPNLDLQAVFQSLLTYLDLIEERTGTDEFWASLDTTSLNGFFDQLSQYATAGVNAGAGAGLNEEDIQSQIRNWKNMDPADLRAAFKQNLRVVRQSLEQYAQILQNPEQVAALLQQIPPELVKVLEAVVKGDTKALQNIIQQIPGLDDSVRTTLSSLLSGDPKQALTSLASNDEQIELARQQFLANPELAAVSEISEDILNDPIKFKKMFQEQLKLLEQVNTATDEGEGEADEAIDFGDETDLKTRERLARSRHAA